MPVSGLVISLHPDPTLARNACHVIAQRRECRLGEQRDRKLALATDTACPEEDRTLWEWLHSLPGVTHVDVVFIQFDDTDASAGCSPQADAHHQREVRR